MARYLKRLVYSAAEMSDTMAQLVMSVEVLRMIDASGYLLDSLLLCCRPLVRENSAGLGTVLKLFLDLTNDDSFKLQLEKDVEMKFDSEAKLYLTSLTDTWRPDPVEATHRTFPNSRGITFFRDHSTKFENGIGLLYSFKFL